MTQRLRSGLSDVTSAALVPHGFTLTLWGAGVLLVRRHGLPTAPEVFAFCGVAALGFSALALLAQAGEAPPATSPVLAQPVAIVGAICAAMLVANALPTALAWALSGAAATVTYFVSIAALRLVLVPGRRDP